MKQQTDIEVLRSYVPYLRLILAFIIWMRYPAGILQSYQQADEFIKQLTKDIKDN